MFQSFCLKHVQVSKVSPARCLNRQQVADSKPSQQTVTKAGVDTVDAQNPASVDRNFSLHVYHYIHYFSFGISLVFSRVQPSTINNLWMYVQVCRCLNIHPMFFCSKEVDWWLTDRHPRKPTWNLNMRVTQEKEVPFWGNHHLQVLCAVQKSGWTTKEISEKPLLKKHPIKQKRQNTLWKKTAHIKKKEKNTPWKNKTLGMYLKQKPKTPVKTSHSANGQPA